jgi:polyisoprenoid-binding protein YceI
MTSKWHIDASHSNLQFSVRHMLISKVRGSFGSFAGSFELDEANGNAPSNVNVTIDAGSIDTREPKRDEHLRSQDFLDVATYPTLSFVGTAAERRGDRFEIRGELSLRGVTRPVLLEAELGGFGKDPWGNERAAFSARASIDREQFGLTWNQLLEAGGVLVGTKIEIEVEIEAVKAAGEAGTDAAAAGGKAA